MKSEEGPEERDSAMVEPWPSSSRTGALAWVRQVTWFSTGCLKQSALGFRARVAASLAE